ncbi:MAG: DUF655 domain-containing protein [Methanobrevibacter sp.]|jgi:putative nucleotide binding protein|nr:DUF655 domain-containing protein [Candidatus Methanoflexus mossambicus]
MEDYAVILDYLPLGYVDENTSTFKKKPIAQAIGTKNFTLLELIPQNGVDLEIDDTVYIGKDKDKRDKISRVKGILDYENLTATSRAELDFVIKDIIEDNNDHFIKFFNESDAVSIRLHMLELLPGIGKKHMEAILKAREEKPFEDFEDLKNRVPLLNDPVGSIVKRVEIEIDTVSIKKGKNKYNIFTQIKKPRPQRDGRNSRNNRNSRDSKNSRGNSSRRNYSKGNSSRKRNYRPKD